MQMRMKTHQLNEDAIQNLLSRAKVGSLSTINVDGTPYIVPVHFVNSDGKIYFHCSQKGQKTDNILNISDVCFMVYEMLDMVSDDDKPCSTNTKYESVVITGDARIVDDYNEKLKVLSKIVEKYTPHLCGCEMPKGSVDGTSVVAIAIKSVTGKYY